MRIEVGYGLEGMLTDATSKLIIANAAAPRFKTGDYDGGVTRAVEDIVTALTTDAADWKPEPETSDGRRPTTTASLPILIFVFILIVIWNLSRRGRRTGGAWIVPINTGGWSSGGGCSGGGSFDSGFSGGGGSSGGGGASGRLVMRIDAAAAREIEAAFAAAQARTRAPLGCVVAESSADYALGARAGRRGPGAGGALAAAGLHRAVAGADFSRPAPRVRARAWRASRFTLGARARWFRGRGGVRPATAPRGAVRAARARSRAPSATACCSMSRSPSAMRASSPTSGSHVPQEAWRAADRRAVRDVARGRITKGR